MSTYIVRYQLGGNEQSDTVQADTAASAVQQVEERYLAQEERFELIEVHLIEDEDDLIRDRQQPVA